MAVRRTHFKFSKGPNWPAAHDQFRIRPLTRNVDAGTVNLPVWDLVQLDGNGETYLDLIAAGEGSPVGYEIKEAPGKLNGPVVFSVPEGEGVFEYADALPPQPGAYLYDLTGNVDFPDEAPYGSQGIDYYTGNIYQKGL